MKITNHEKIYGIWEKVWEAVRNIIRRQGNIVQNVWEQGNSVKENIGLHHNLFLKNKKTTVKIYREQGNTHPQPLRVSPNLPRRELTETVAQNQYCSFNCQRPFEKFPS